MNGEAITEEIKTTPSGEANPTLINEAEQNTTEYIQGDGYSNRRIKVLLLMSREDKYSRERNVGSQL
ncbi:hypothetical protein CEXT_131061 [Caerostris extrusa]|uniref:Uncharacterized protein n=1 Tax=Caerostris extrusa TaxID=172846 RepID=A0AAV4SFV1_CAEEX|nr:hypothetical protein CEXT_131061 [Caerostris extrusa]